MIKCLFCFTCDSSLRSFKGTLFIDKRLVYGYNSNFNGRVKDMDVNPFASDPFLVGSSKKQKLRSETFFNPGLRRIH